MISLAAMVIIPAGAQALTAVGSGSVLTGDGHRFVAFQTPSGNPAVLDSRTLKVRQIRDAKDCVPADVGFGRVLLDCTEGWYFDYRSPRLASVWTGESRPVSEALKSESYDRGEIGRFWIRGDCDAGSPCYSVVYRNFRTGARKSFSTVGNSADVGPPGLSVSDYDLDRRRFGRFEPHPGFSIFTGSFDWSAYLGYGRSYYLLNRQRGMTLVRSPMRSVRIGPYLPGAEGPSQTSVKTGSGRIVWVRGRRLHCFNLRAGTREQTRFDKAADSAAVVRKGAVVAFPAGVTDKKRRYGLRLVRF